MLYPLLPPSTNAERIYDYLTLAEVCGGGTVVREIGVGGTSLIVGELTEASPW